MSDPSRPSRRYLTMVVASLSFIALSCVAFLVPVPYVTLSPGPAYDTLDEFRGKPMFEIGTDAKTYPTQGSLRFTSVLVTNVKTEVTLAQALQAYFDGETAVIPRSLIYRDEDSAKAVDAKSLAELTSSKDASRVAGLRAAGFTVPELPYIADVAADGAAKGKLRKGDVIRSVDGRATETMSSVLESIAGLEPGDRVVIGYERDGKNQEVEITTRPDAKDASVPRVGVGLRAKFDFPVKITNNVEKVGGTSAGMMFALSIYDRLTPGALTGGRDIAGTGTIAPDGKVGPIGGIRQKIIGAADDGATIFLVPDANCADAVDGGAHGQRLVKVTTLQSAIDALEKLADDPKASVPQCP